MPGWFEAIFFTSKSVISCLGGRGAERLPGWFVHFVINFGHVRGGGLKLFGQWPHGNNAFQKGTSLTTLLFENISFFATGSVIILHVEEKKCHEPFFTTPGGTEGTTLHMVESAVRLWTFPTTQSSQTFITEGLTTVSSIGKRVTI